MTTRETAEENRAGQLAMDITLAPQGFVQKVRQQEWHLGKDKKGMPVAYVRILVPASEVARIESEQVAIRQAKREPYENARRQFSRALFEHRLTDAAQMVNDLVVLAKHAKRVGMTREQLVAEIQGVVDLSGTISYQVTGTKERLSDGQFHQFVEVQSIGSANIQLPSRKNGSTNRSSTGFRQPAAKTPGTQYANPDQS